MSDKTPYKKNLDPRHFDELFREIQKDLLYYNIVEKDLSTSETSVEHKLNRKPTGYIVIGKDGVGDVYSSSTADSKFLYLTSDATINVKLLVF